MTRFRFGDAEYEVDRLLGRGGMAEVYLAHRVRQGGLQELVVIKRLLPMLARNREFIRRFLREANIGGKLKHRNIVRLLDVGRDGDSYCLVMEYVEGRNLQTMRRAVLAAGHAFPPWLAARIIADVAGALQVAHSYRDGSERPQPIIHRDVSPDNIMVAVGGVVKLLDFGVAKDAQGIQLTQAGQIVGKPIYFCPEAARGEMPTPQWDIYSLGAVLYELLAGQAPFAQDGNDHRALLGLFRRLLSEEPPPPRAINSATPTGLEVVVRRAMAKKPEYRYATAADLQEELENCLAAEAGPVTEAMLDDFLRDPAAVLGRAPELLVGDATVPDARQRPDPEGPTDPDSPPPGAEPRRRRRRR